MAHSKGVNTSTGEVLSAVRLSLVAGNRPVTRLLVDGVEVLLQERGRWQRLVAEPDRIEARIVFSTLVRRFPGMRLATPGEVTRGRPPGRWVPVVLAPGSP